MKTNCLPNPKLLSNHEENIKLQHRDILQYNLTSTSQNCQSSQTRGVLETVTAKRRLKRLTTKCNVLDEILEQKKGLT